MNNLAIKELGVFILEKFKHPNSDMSFLGTSSSHSHIERDIMATLKMLANPSNKVRQQVLLNELRGQVLSLNTVQFYSDKETDEILDKISKAENS